MARIAAKATKGKGKRWQRGQSSSSNPTTTKHRAKVAQTSNGSGPSSLGGFKLTKDLLDKLDKINLQRQRQAELASGGGETETIGDWIAKTEPNTALAPLDDVVSLGNTVASVWTNVSNVSFNKFLNGFNAKSKIHRAMLSVLATIREAIELEKGQETETEYFGALMLALNVVDSEEKMTATLALIQLILRRVPVAVLKLKFSETSSTLLRILGEHSSSSSLNIYLLKSIISSLGVLLKPQERPVWELQSTQRIFDTLLLLLLHVKPRIRKASAKVVVDLVCDDQAAGAPVARKLLASFAIRKLEQHLATIEDDHLNIVLYIFTLLGETMHLFPSVSDTKKACETILSHVTLGNVLIVTSALRTFHSFFMKRPQNSVLSADLNGKLVTALYDYQPNINDAQPLSAWCTALKEALLSLANLDPSIAEQHLMKFTKTMIACLHSDSEQVHFCVCDALEVVFGALVIGMPDSSNKAQLLVPGELARSLYGEQLEQVLKYQFSPAWVPAIRMLSHLIIDHETLNDANATIMQRLAILYESGDASLNQAIDAFFAQALAVFGARKVLASCPIMWRASQAPMESSGSFTQFCGEFSNSWLLPILRLNVGNARRPELAIWVDHFQPMAKTILRESDKCDKLAARLKSQLEAKMDVEDEKTTYKAFAAHESCLAAKKELRRCAHALWALLPSFAKNPVDGAQVLPKFAQKLGEALYKKEFASYALAALKNILAAPDDNKSLLEVMSKFCKNYLPIMFNIYTQEKDMLDVSLRPLVLRLVAIFLVLMLENENGPQAFAQLYRQISEKCAEPGASDYRRNALLNLQRAFLMSPRGLEVNDIETLYATVCTFLHNDQSAGVREQKNALRILEAILASESPACQQFINNNKNAILSLLFEILSKPKFCRSPSTRALALRSMQRLVEKFGSVAGAEGKLAEWRETFDKLLPIVYHTMLVKSAKAVKAAKEMLLMLADAFQALEGESDGEEVHLIKMFIDPVVAQADEMDVNERTARLAALVYLYDERYHHPSVASSVKCRIADFVLSEMQNEKLVAANATARRVLDIGFNFIKTFMSKTSVDLLESYIEAITCTITKVPEQHRLKFRMRIRVILVKLIRKFGFNLISKMVLEDYQKVLKNIRKEEVRKKKNKDDKDEDGEDDEDDDEDDAKSKRSKRHKTSLFDSDDEDEIEQFVETEWGDKMDEDDQDDARDNRRKKKTKDKFDLASRLSNKTSKSFIREMADGDPIDLLDPSTSKNVFSKIPKKFKQTQGEAGNAEEQDVKLKSLPMSNDGRIIIKDLFSKLEKSTPHAGGGDGGSSKRKTIDESEDGDDDEEDKKTTDDNKSKLSYRPGGRGIHRPLSVAGSDRSRRSRRSNNDKSQISRGDAYSSKSARGDMKRKGRPDPYAYYPLNPIAMNKRKALKYKGEFKALVKAAQKGSAAGIKIKNHKIRKNK